MGFILFLPDSADDKSKTLLALLERRGRGDVALYARLEAVRVLLTGRREWGVVSTEGAGARGAVGREWMLRGVGEGGL